MCSLNLNNNVEMNCYGIEQLWVLLKDVHEHLCN